MKKFCVCGHKERAGLLVKSLLSDILSTFVAMDSFREMNLAQESVVNSLDSAVNSLEYLVLFVFTSQSSCVVDDGASPDGSTWFIMVVCCLSKFVAFRILSLSRVLGERVFKYVGGDCPRTSKSGPIPFIMLYKMAPVPGSNT